MSFGWCVRVFNGQNGIFHQIAAEFGRESGNTLKNALFYENKNVKCAPVLIYFECLSKFKLNLTYGKIVLH